MTDCWGRDIHYLRLSVTDRCNLRCRYCMPEEGVTPVPHDQVLTYEEMLEIVRRWPDWASTGCVSPGASPWSAGT